MVYIATFYSHFGAIQFRRLHQQALQEIQLMPVPRNLSSSCGTCAKFICTDESYIASIDDEELEQIVRCDGDRYTSVHSNKL